MPFVNVRSHDPLSAAARARLARTIAILRDLPGLRPDLGSYVEQVAVVSAMISSGTTETGEPVTVHDLRHADVPDDVAWGARAIADAWPDGSFTAQAVADLPELLQIAVVADVIACLEGAPTQAALGNAASLTEVVFDMSPPSGPWLAMRIEQLANADWAVAPLHRRTAKAA